MSCGGFSSASGVVVGEAWIPSLVQLKPPHDTPGILMLSTSRALSGCRPSGATGLHRSRHGRHRAPGAIHRPCCQRSPRRRWRAIWRPRCRRWPATRRTVWRLPWRGWDGRSWPATRAVFPECSRCGETLPRVKSYWQQPVRTGRRKKGRRIEQEAAGRGCAAASIRSACATKPLDCRQNLHLAGISKIATGKSL